MNANHISLAEMPVTAGVSFRYARGEEDAGAIHDLRAGCVEQDQVDLDSASEGLPSCAEIRAALAEAAASSQLDRRLLAEVDGRTVAASQINTWREDDGRWVYLVLGWVLPEWRGRGLGTAMLHWGEQAARHLATVEHPGEPFEFAANASSTQPDAATLLANEGYTAGYTVIEMGLDFTAISPVTPLPEGIEVRAVSGDHYALIAECMQAAYRDEYAGRRFQESMDVEECVAQLKAQNHKPELWQIGWAGEQVAGMVIPVVENDRAIMYDISVHPGWRRRGLARALLTRCLRDLVGRGIPVIRLNTVAEFQTRAKDLYQSVGFRLLKEFPRYRKQA